MRRNSKRFVSCLLVMALALALMAGCGAKSDDIEVKSLGQELFPETTGLLDTLKMVQEGGGSSTASAKSEGKTKESSEDAGGDDKSDAVQAEVGFIKDITDTINSPEDEYGETVSINNAFGEAHDVNIECAKGYYDETTYDWKFFYSSDNPFSFTTELSGDKLDYCGVYYFGQDTEELSVIMTTTDKDGNPHTMIGSYVYDEDGMYWMYWSTEGRAYSVIFEPLEGAFENYSDGSVTVGGTTYQMGDNLTLIP